jgi:hypothetical protein
VFDVHKEAKTVLNEKDDWVDILLYVVPKNLNGSDIIKIFGFTWPGTYISNVGASFREHSRNIQGTFREHSGNIQGTFREHSGSHIITGSLGWGLPT